MIVPGRFIVVEGLEGAGKTSAIATIRQYLRPFAPNIIVTREPGGTKIGEKLRDIIKEDANGESLEILSELLIMYAARVQVLEKVIRPALKRGDWVIADRFELSTFAYQGGGRGISKTILNSLSSICLQGFKPDFTIFLDILPKEGLQRVKFRGEFDRIEQESLTFFNNVADAYHQAIMEMDNACTIDASSSVEIVQESILKQLKIYCSRLSQ